eukprot:TRINITY_DN5875_c0_g1_i2.p1 TRINITY_DN5875_c0_g1~~TRINITY_DN5875_c0_g1_i2.p1  ORF type:complete len:631 (+),score=164.10 TRINITY_DN5875_c0_g1_i2:1348-3240(+)
MLPLPAGIPFIASSVERGVQPSLDDHKVESVVLPPPSPVTPALASFENGEDEKKLAIAPTSVVARSAEESHGGDELVVKMVRQNMDEIKGLIPLDVPNEESAMDRYLENYHPMVMNALGRYGEPFLHNVKHIAGLFLFSRFVIQAAEVLTEKSEKVHSCHHKVRLGLDRVLIVSTCLRSVLDTLNDFPVSRCKDITQTLFYIARNLSMKIRSFLAFVDNFSQTKGMLGNLFSYFTPDNSLRQLDQLLEGMKEDSQNLFDALKASEFVLLHEVARKLTRLEEMKSEDGPIVEEQDDFIVVRDVKLVMENEELKSELNSKQFQIREFEAKLAEQAQLLEDSKKTVLLPNLELPKPQPKLIKRSDEKLGSGATADVWRGKYGPQDIALKVLKAQVPVSLQEQFNKEIALYAHLNHPNILRCYGVTSLEENPAATCIVLGYAKHGSLRRILATGVPQLATEQKWQIAFGIAVGMDYLHRLSSNAEIIHRDLKSDNVVLSDDLVPMITDFGLAKVREVSEQLNTSSTLIPSMTAGSRMWQAPECLRNQFSKQSDVYAYGCILYDLYFGRPPFEGWSVGNIEKHLEELKNPLDALRLSTGDSSAKLPKQWEDLMVKCWAPDPKARPSFEQILVEFS